MSARNTKTDVPTALPLENRAWLAVGFLVLVALTDALALTADFSWLDIVRRVLDGERVPFEEVQSIDDRLRASWIAQLVAYVLAIVAFLLWYSRAFRNTIAMGARPARFRTRDAVVAWFIPFLNIFYPKRVMNDIWRASDPDAPADFRDFSARPVTPLIHVWWALWLIGNIAFRIAAERLDDGARSDLEATAQLYLAADVLDLVAALFAALVVRMVTKRQELRRHRFQGGTLPGPPMVSLASPPPAGAMPHQPPAEAPVPTPSGVADPHPPPPGTPPPSDPQHPTSFPPSKPPPGW